MSLKKKKKKIEIQPISFSSRLSVEAQVTFSNPHHVIIIWINKHLHTNPLQQNKSHAVRLSHHVHYLRRYHKTGAITPQDCAGLCARMCV